MSAQSNTATDNKDASGRESTPVDGQKQATDNKDASGRGLTPVDEQDKIPNPPMVDGSTRGAPQLGGGMVLVPRLDPPSSGQKEGTEKLSDETPPSST